MCGILGSINLPFEKDVVNLIHHRGPDDTGSTTIKLRQNLIMLAHTRLAIVDLSPAGHQPMSTTDGACTIVFNGEVYNHEKLRREVTQTEFRGHSDTETILYWLAEKGIQSIADLNGIFALAFVDSRLRKLFLARDPFGVKPLYYAAQGRSFIFCSEIKPILKLVDDRLDMDNLAELLRLRYSPSPDTLFRSIKKVRPGHVMEVDFSEPTVKFKEYPYIRSIPTVEDVSYDEAVARYGSLFEQAVKRQLMSDVEVGILLSGGIDSALVASYAQKHSPGRLKGFTVGFKEKSDTDEILLAKETASIIGMDHHVVRIDFDDFLTTIKKCTSIVEEPLATTSVIPMFYLSELASQHVKVVLSGQGTDESLGGYGRYQGEIYGNIIPRWLFRVMNWIVPYTGIHDEQLLRGLESLGIDDTLSRFLSVYSVFDNEEIRALIGEDDSKSRQRISYFYDLLECNKRAQPIERLMSLDLRMDLADDLLLYTDKITMHHSIECRVPMLDLELVRFLESLPSHYKVRLRRSKIIHKEFASKTLPNSVVNRKKKGFLSPTRLWFKESGVMREILLSPHSRFSSFFDLKKVASVLKQHQDGFNRERHIFLLLGIYHWMEEYL
jgi:asparagine synthase (glutamine-hydrolysing)